MPSLYDRADIYDLLETDDRFDAYKRHWEHVLRDTGIRSLLDVSIGSGCVTLPLAELGVELSGSDLSEAMLANCRKKVQSKGYSVDLQHSDFRDLSCWQGKKFGCVASTGNSLAYVTNSQVRDTLTQMDALVADGGYLYLDTRNWDRIMEMHQRFYFFNPFFSGETRVNLLQVWDYLADGSILFNIVYSFEQNNKVFQREIFEEHYHPLPRRLLLDQLAVLGYREVRQFCFPAFLNQDAENAEWYCILAKKSINNIK